MDMNIILAGVGGQGVLSIAFVLDSIALKNSYYFKQAEVHGMAQRGGAVESHLRFSKEPIWSDIIPSGEVDLILSIEPLEVLRYMHTLRPEGCVVTSSNPFVNIPNYPELEGVLSKIAALPSHVMVDTKSLAKLAGSARSENIVVLGAASPILPFAAEQALEVIASMFAKKGQKLVDVNLRAFDLGRRASLFYKAGIAAGLEVCDVRRLMKRLDPADLEAEAAAVWAKSMDKLPEGDEILPGTVAYISEL